MPPFTYFLVLLAFTLAMMFVLRLALLWSGRRLQKRIGFSDTALTDLAITVPLLAFVVAFVAGMAWLWR